MRAPLDKLERLDNYLNDKLTAEEQQQFMSDLGKDKELKELLNIQQEIIQTIKRKALKAEINKTIKNISLWVRIRNWIISAGVLTVIVLAAYMILRPSSPTSKMNVGTIPVIHKEKTANVITKEAITTIKDTLEKQKTAVAIPSQPLVTASKVNEDDAIEFNGLKTWVRPDVQTFSINPLKGSTIEGKEGTLVIIPPNAFLNEKDQPVTDQVELKLVEALTLEDMVLYNLATTADNKALETGGMLNFDFSCLGKPVKVNPQQPLYVEVPTNEVKKDMMVFKGEVTNGKVNWKNPEPIKKYLQNVNFKDLDFLPAYFKDTVNVLLPEVGFKTILSNVVDSLYYSLSNCENDDESGDRKVLDLKNKTKTTPSPSKLKTGQKTAQAMPIASLNKQNCCCGIDPLSIKTIKTNPYSRTFVATQEFAERVRALQKHEKGNELLQVYLKNLKKDMAYSDSIVAGKIKDGNEEVFVQFAEQKLTNVMNVEIYQDQLNAYYEKQHQENSQKKEKLQNELRNKKVAELKQLISETGNLKGLKGNSSVISMLASEVPVTKQVYAFQWSSPGWVNIDQYLHLLDKGSEEIAMNVKGAQGITEVYQWLNTIKNLTPLTIHENSAKAMFPRKDIPEAQLMQNTFCFAISKKNDQYKWFDLRYNPYDVKMVDVDLQPITIEEIRSKLKSYDVKQDIEKRLAGMEKEIQEAIHYKTELEKKLKENKKMTRAEELMMKELYWKQVRSTLRSVAFPCELEKRTDKYSSPAGGYRGGSIFGIHFGNGVSITW